MNRYPVTERENINSKSNSNQDNRAVYTNAKTEFVRKWTFEAKRVYAGKYSENQE